MKKWLLFLFTVCITTFVFAQEMPMEHEPYAAQWQKADSLLNGGFPKSAAEIARNIYAEAKKKGQEVQMLKAQIYLMSSLLQTEEDAYKEAIVFAEKEINTTNFPVKNIWQSIAAQLYWQYYTSNRWQILQRTAVDGGVAIEDFEQWDAGRFYGRVSNLYEASLNNFQQLEKIDIDKYNPILEKGKNTASLRPTLFDLLVFRAIEFFENDEKELTKPAYEFIMNDPAAFAPAGQFINHTFATKDTASLHRKALQLYQQTLQLHKDDTNPDAFIDADLHRLEFAYQNSVLPNKKELYVKALERIANQYSNNPLAALALYRIAQTMAMNVSNPFSSYQEQVPDIDYVAIKKRLEEIIQKYPNSEGAVYAEHQLQSIISKQLMLQAEQVVLPNDASKVLVQYKNVPEIWMRVVKVSAREYMNLSQRGNQKELVRTKPLQSWKVDLKGTEDYAMHSTEVKVEELPVGNYIIIASTSPAFDVGEDVIYYTSFQVSELAFILQQDGDNIGYVLHRKTGKPIADVTIEIFESRYRKNNYQDEVVLKMKSDKNGSVSLNKRDGNYRAAMLYYNNDTLITNEGIYLYGRNNPNNTDRKSTRTFFFTDRSIYRPGQTIYFKGIMVNTEDNGRKNEVIPNQKTEVTFYDVNNQKINTLQLVTNEYGSFSGTFTAPEGGLTGMMRIDNGTGSAYISVEEYKRPKFFVSFDTLKKEYALNEQVTVTGNAKDYAGSNIDNAVVKYRVERSTYFPYPWLRYDYSWLRNETTIMEQGTVTTDESGNFQITFPALPDEQVAKEAQPTFIYTIYADVTDINGETRSAQTRIRLGYAALQIVADIPEQVKPETLDTLRITTQTLNGVFTPAQVTVNITKLKAPDNILRERYWQQPDMHIMSEEEFKRFFPHDEYKNESQPQNWEKEKTVLNKSFTTTTNGALPIGKKLWNENGWYLIEITTKDKNGLLITDKKYVQVWSNDNRGKVYATLLAVPSLQTVEPDNTVTVHITSGFDELYILQQQSQHSEESYQTLSFSGKPLQWNKTITEDDRGGISLHYTTVKNNRVYQQEAYINVPWTNKDLNISWETHRDKLKPNEEETWTMVVSGNKKEKVAAEMVATLYDASLDAFKPHQWNINGLYPTYTDHNRLRRFGFSINNGSYISNIQADYERRSYEKVYDRLKLPFRRYEIYRYMDAAAVAAPAPEGARAPKLQMANAEESAEAKFTPPVVGNDEEGESKSDLQQPQEIPVRTDFRETAFFYPHLQTDAQGNIRIQFTMPEALTEWKLMAFAHTKDMRYGTLEGSVKTQKDLMVMPNLPRFLRQGDDIVLTTKINNLTTNNLNGTATIEVLDAQTMKSLSLPFRLEKETVSFSANANQSSSVSWKLHVPESLYQPVIIRIVASAGNFTDGEENLIPVVTNRMLVTETLPMYVNGNGTKTYDFEALKQSANSKTIAQHALTVEYTGNPAWYAVQALPYLMEYPYECAEQVFNRYYANALAAHIVAQAPKVKTIFDKWNTTDTAALLSNLQKNQELKTALLEETPWVLDAQSEAQQKKNIAMLFEANKLSKSLNASMRKLKDMQLPDGAFPWFRGMQPDRYITQYIITGLARLQHLGLQDAKGNMQDVIQKALPYLDRKIKEDYELLLEHKTDMDKQHIGHIQIQYLYMRSYYGAPDGDATTAFNYYKKQAAKYWPSFNAYMKGMIALSQNRMNEKQTATNIINSLRETAITKDEMGMYWVRRGNSYWWYDAPIETQALLIECFKEAGGNKSEEINQMKIWLLKQKQTQSWPTTKATADACFALLLSGTQWLENEPQVTLKLGAETVSPDAKEAGTGYFKTKFTGSEIEPAMGNIAVTVSGNENSTSWGAVYWQYFEDMDKIKSAATPLEIKKQLFIERNTDRGKELQAITSGNQLNVGDKVVVRIEILVDRDMEYVHLKDMRASCFEPVNVLSGYRWQAGLGYYESTKDMATNFFISYLPRGKYVFEYPVFVSNKGNFSNGIATIQCMYAPEFSSHSEGIRVTVE